jgi:hypothetical protein
MIDLHCLDPLFRQAGKTRNSADRPEFFVFSLWRVYVYPDCLIAWFLNFSN